MKRKVNTLQGFKKGGKKQDWVSEKISMLMKEGRPQDQAVAMALSMWNQKHENGGYQLPMYQEGASGTIDPNYKFPSTINSQGAFPTTTGFPSTMNLSTTNPDNEYQKFFASKLAESSNMGTSIDGSTQDKNREEAKNTVTSWQTPQIYGGTDLAGASNLLGKSIGEGNVGMGILSGLKLATGLGRNILGGYGRAQRDASVMKSASENLKESVKGIGSEEAFAYGGYFSQGGYMPMYQDGDIYGDQEGYSNDLIDKYARSNAYPMNQQEQSVDAGLVPAQETYMRQIPLQQVSSTPTIDPNSARDVWTAKTGLSWAEAKKRGYTDGSASGNKALLDRFRKENVASILENKPKRASTRVARATQNRTQTENRFTEEDINNANIVEKYIRDEKIRDEKQAAADWKAYRKQNPAVKRNTGDIKAPEEGNMITRAGEILANPIQSFGNLAKYGELPAEGFSKNSKNAYDQVIGLANPFYWANALGNAADYAAEGEYKKAALESLDALPAAGKIKYVRYLPLDKASKQIVEKAIPLLSKKGALTAAEKAIVYEAKTVSDVAIRQAAKPITGMAKYYPKGANQIGQGPLNMYYDPLQLASGARQLTSGAKQLGSGAPQLSQGARRLGFEEGGYYQEGGMQEAGAEQQGGDQTQQVMQEVSQALQQGADPQEVLQQLVQMGVPQDQATQLVQQVLEMMQQQEGQQAPPQLRQGGEMIKRADGSYSRRGMWDNIRDNEGSGKRPTREMLEQERKIKSEYEYGGMYGLDSYREGGEPQNAGFQALPDSVKAKIMNSMEDGGMYDMEEYRDGGTIPERYKNMGFNQVGVKKQSTRPGKKWMVLAKKGDQYKVVHGGDSNMKDFSQHGSEKRKENFWNRMGGRDSAKANDPFSPLYWHKKFGTWQEGGEMMDEQMEGENEGAEGETPNMEQIEDQVEQALKQGADPQQILQQLVQMGMPEEQAVQMIQEILQEIQGGETEQETPEQPMMRDGGNYLSALKGKTIKNYTYNSKTGNYDVEFE